MVPSSLKELFREDKLPSPGFNIIPYPYYPPVLKPMDHKFTFYRASTKSSVISWIKSPVCPEAVTVR
jgi:hypothetical protein